MGEPSGAPGPACCFSTIEEIRRCRVVGTFKDVVRVVGEDPGGGIS